MLQSGRGSVINIASVSAHIPLSRVIAYSAAKAAVLSLSQFWRVNGLLLVSGSTPSRQDSFQLNRIEKSCFMKTGVQRLEPRASWATLPWDVSGGG